MFYWNLDLIADGSCGIAGYLARLFDLQLEEKLGDRGATWRVQMDSWNLVGRDSLLVAIRGIVSFS